MKKYYVLLLVGLFLTTPLHAGPIQTLNIIVDYSGESLLPLACYFAGASCGVEVALKWTGKRSEKDFFQNESSLIFAGSINFIGLLICSLLKPSYPRYRCAGLLIPLTVYALMSGLTTPNGLDSKKEPLGFLYGLYLGLGGLAGAIVASSLVKLYF